MSKQQIKEWCKSKGYEFIGISPDGERVKFIDGNVHSNNYRFSLLNIAAILTK